MAALVCPVCGGELCREETRYVCPAGHSFDRARSGYVNLLRSSSQGRHGDDKLMVRARREFLEQGYYDPLSEAVCEAATAAAGEHCVLVDAGCGEGKYTAVVFRALDAAGKTAEIVGVDISKDALAYAARRLRGAEFAVASSAHLPLKGESADIVLNIFSPLAAEEFARVLRPGGTLVRVYPLERHLWELKALIYERPYENPPTPLEIPGFVQAGTRSLRYAIHLHSAEDVMRLFRMTPYYYKTGKADQRKAAEAQSLDVTLEFGITVYRKR